MLDIRAIHNETTVVGVSDTSLARVYAATVSVADHLHLGSAHYQTS
jgi:hypothetical protein